MRFKSKIIITSFFLLFQIFLFAHNPQQSSLKLIIFENNGFLNISLSQYGIEQALIKKYPNLDLSSVEPNDFKELLIKYLKEHIILSVDGHQLKIGKGVIKLGNHQTDLKFEINNFPENPKSMNADVSCFQENERQNNFFTILYKGLTTRAKLEKNNNFKCKFTFSNSEIYVNTVDSYSLKHNMTLWINIFSIFILTIVVFLVFRLKEKT